MTIKKSELYSSLWAGCDELRGSMDASQYKDYVLVLLFMKYVSDKGGALVEIPQGASFSDMVKLKGKSDIGDKINKIISSLARANDLTGIITVADFNDDDKLGKDKAKVDRLSNLIDIFNKPELDFSDNRAEGDDLLGDAYEYLMRHFATESGKSKGQFYTPAEVSRVMASVIGIHESKSQSQTLYDPTCGSGSLLLRAASEAPKGITIYGQENDNATRALAVMNMWLHNNPSSEILLGNTLASPEFRDEKTGKLKTFDYAVANPPFSFKSWMNGFDPANDEFGRFDGFELPPKKNGDYAFLLHFIKSLKNTGKGCIVMPLGVLFRGNTEAQIRKNLIQRGYIKAIIGLPANLFYGTGIAACLIVIDKKSAAERDSIFMIDASKGFIKDGNKNRLRERDIRKMVDTYQSGAEIPGYSRRIAYTEIEGEKNDYNLNIPRYIDNQDAEDQQNIEAHLKGGIPDHDVKALGSYWQVYPGLQKSLFQKSKRAGFWDLKVKSDSIRQVIFDHPEFIDYSKKATLLFTGWQKKTATHLRKLDQGHHPKQEITKMARDLFTVYDSEESRALIDPYDVFQHLMDYWHLELQDDLYEITADGWLAGNQLTRLYKKQKQGEKKKPSQIAGIEGLQGTLIPPQLLIQEYFGAAQKEIEALQNSIEELVAQMDELREEHAGEEGLLANATNDKGTISKATLNQALKEAEDGDEEHAMLIQYRELLDQEAEIKKEIKAHEKALEDEVITKYPELSIREIQNLVVDKKWMAQISKRIQSELDNISHRLSTRIKELAERYETPLPQITTQTEQLTRKVEEHLKRMGYQW